MVMVMDSAKNLKVYLAPTVLRKWERIISAHVFVLERVFKLGGRSSC
jgi:hypothetical protein